MLNLDYMQKKWRGKSYSPRWHCCWRCPENPGRDGCTCWWSSHFSFRCTCKWVCDDWRIRWTKEGDFKLMSGTQERKVGRIRRKAWWFSRCYNSCPPFRYLNCNWRGMVYSNRCWKKQLWWKNQGQAWIKLWWINSSSDKAWLNRIRSWYTWYVCSTSDPSCATSKILYRKIYWPFS